MEISPSPLLESRRYGPVTPNYGSQSNSMISGSVGHSKSNYEVFDPLNWMLDGLVDFPYSYAAIQGLEANDPGQTSPSA